MVAGNRVGDISAAIQQYVESRGLHVDARIHRSRCWAADARRPSGAQLRLPGRGMLLRNGMTIALEPMVLVGTSQTRVMPDEWTVASAGWLADGSF